MTTRPPPTARQPSSTKPAAPPTTKDPSTLLHPTAVLTGTHPLTLGPNTIVQVRARLNTTHNPLTIGASTTIAERASVGYLSPPSPPRPSSPDPATIECTIGTSVIIESGATVEARSVGDYSIIEAGAVVGKGARIGRYCKICAKVEVAEGGVVEDGMVVWGDGGWDRRRMEEEGKGLRGQGVREGMVEGVVGGVRAVWKGK